MLWPIYAYHTAFVSMCDVGGQDLMDVPSGPLLELLSWALVLPVSSLLLGKYVLVLFTIHTGSMASSQY